ncbi:MAG: adenylate/guanylate cyclase domain-containing protein [Kofleriaceae bacterium]|nr:adenylate/guanylate cyclase domain-containing protein [Myxococcales bacterium]MCB9564713.1 adenylate/guanylate cyclase domain-containing protein [Kofleriaceae bacterium]MCB9573948.1 adenylate/guanylate cyclase domain-containing protein [Kofleriaceae bacterium]
MTRTRSQRSERLVAGLLVGALVGALAALVAYARPQMVERAEWWTYDQRARDAADRTAASPDIVIVEISEQDLEDAENVYGVTWPWPRAMFGYLAQYAQRAGARAIVYDWLFQDRGQYSVSDAEDFAAAMRDNGHAVIGLAMTQRSQVSRATEGPWAARLASFATWDEAQAVALQLLAWNTRSYVVPAGADGPYTLFYGGKKSVEDLQMTWQRLMSADELQGLFLVDPGDGGEPVPAEPVPVELSADDLARQVTIESVIARRDGVDLGARGGFLPERRGVDPPLAPIAAAPAHAGNVYQDFEADGIMRRYAPAFRHDGRVYPSLALAAYLVAHPDQTIALDGQALVLGGRRIRLDGDGRFGVRFHGAHVYPHLRAFEVLRSLALLDEGKPPSVPLEALAGKYVFVAASGQALRDIRVTPVSKFQEGAEVNANALDNLESGRVIVRASRVTDAIIAFLLAVAIALAMVALWTSLPRGSLALAATSAATALVLIGYWLLASWQFDHRGLWLGVATPAIGTSLSAFAALLVTSAAERRGRRFVQEALGRYTSRELVRELMAHPEHLSLEWGESREMSVYFSDIAGFTTISEGLPPERLVALLNEYLTHMTDLVLAHGGVVDKYIGDAVMAFWGAPLPDKDHAIKAVRCALAMRKKCDELRATWQAEYGAEVRARAGVNSGKAVVGNMGSKHKYNYTVMGDMVNLASRLEGANKPYGTYLMISEFTHARVADHVDVRELDYLTVKGKEQPVRVFEVLDEKGRSEPAALRAVARYHEGLGRYRERDFAGAIAAFEAALQEKPDDRPSLMYIERCRHFQDAPPPDDWDGVWRLAEK